MNQIEDWIVSLGGLSFAAQCQSVEGKKGWACRLREIVMITEGAAGLPSVTALSGAALAAVYQEALKAQQDYLLVDCDGILDIIDDAFVRVANVHRDSGRQVGGTHLIFDRLDARHQRGLDSSLRSEFNGARMSSIQTGDNASSLAVLCDEEDRAHISLGPARSASHKAMEIRAKKILVDSFIQEDSTISWVRSRSTAPLESDGYFDSQSLLGRPDSIAPLVCSLEESLRSRMADDEIYSYGDGLQLLAVSTNGALIAAMLGHLMPGQVSVGIVDRLGPQVAFRGEYTSASSVRSPVIAVCDFVVSGGELAAAHGYAVGRGFSMVGALAFASALEPDSYKQVPRLITLASMTELRRKPSYRFGDV